MTKKGFSLIELLVTIAILAALMASGTVVFNNFVQKDQLLIVSKEIESVIAEAKIKTVAGFSLGGDQGVNFGVHFSADHYTLFTGISYDPGNLGNQNFPLPTTLEIESIFLQDDSVVFKKINGEVLNYDSMQSSLVLKDKRNSGRKKVTVNQVGVVTMEVL